MLNPLGLTQAAAKVNLQSERSSMEDWKKEAHRLDMQGKTEQADLIRKNILETQKLGWKPTTGRMYMTLWKHHK